MSGMKGGLAAGRAFLNATEGRIFLVTGVAVSALAAYPEARSVLGWHESDFPTRAWTLASCHFVHLGGRHLVANLLALALLAWTAFLAGSGARLPLAMLGAMMGVSAGLLLGPWQIAWYAGLSGVLYGVFAHLSLGILGRARALALLLYLGGALKVVLDLNVAVGSEGALGIPLAPPAHLYGYLGGSLSALLAPALRRRPR